MSDANHHHQHRLTQHIQQLAVTTPATTRTPAPKSRPTARTHPLLHPHDRTTTPRQSNPADYTTTVAGAHPRPRPQPPSSPPSPPATNLTTARPSARRRRRRRHHRRHRRPALVPHSIRLGATSPGKAHTRHARPAREAALDNPVLDLPLRLQAPPARGPPFEPPTPVALQQSARPDKAAVSE